MVIDPRAGYRYVATLVARVVGLQGGLLLRAALNQDGVLAVVVADRSNVRSIA